MAYKCRKCDVDVERVDAQPGDLRFVRGQDDSVPLIHKGCGGKLLSCPKCGSDDVVDSGSRWGEGSALPVTTPRAVYRCRQCGFSPIF